jgi:hypothetical protein
MSIFPGPGKALAAAAAPDASSRLIEVLGVRPRSTARGVMVSTGRVREPSVWIGVVSLGFETEVKIYVLVVRKY